MWQSCHYPIKKSYILNCQFGMTFFFINFGTIPWQAAEIIGGLLASESQNHRVTELQSDRHPRVLSIQVGEFFLYLILINSPTCFSCRGIIQSLEDSLPNRLSSGYSIIWDFMLSRQTKVSSWQCEDLNFFTLKVHLKNLHTFDWRNGNGYLKNTFDWNLWTFFCTLHSNSVWVSFLIKNFKTVKSCFLRKK